MGKKKKNSPAKLPSVRFAMVCLAALASAISVQECSEVVLFCRVSQGLLSVTEELHSLSFEACFTVQGLTIDLEVRLCSDFSH